MLAPLAIILVLGICYICTIAPDLTWAHLSADGGDLITATVTGGVPHPSGYPLYMILARGFQFIPIETLAFRTNLFSAVCTILTALVLYKYLDRLLPVSLWARYISFITSIGYGLAPFIWGQALVTEVYALHGLLMIVCLFVLGVNEIKISEWLRGGVFGLAATNHLTSILLFPLLAIGLDKKPGESFSIIFRRSLGILSSLSLYLLLPLRAVGNPPINWGNASSINGFFWLVSGQLYARYSTSLSLADILQRFRAFAGLLLVQYTVIGVLLGIYGLFSGIPRRVLVPTVWMGLVFLFFSVFYGSYDSQVNLLPVWLVFSIWIAYGLFDLFSFLQDRAKLQKLLAPLLFLLLMIRLPFVYPSVDLSKDSQATDFIKQSLLEIPKDSIVFVEGDGQIFSLWYAQFALNQRKDMMIIASGLLPYPWYLEGLQQTYPYLNLPEKKELHPQDLTYANPNRPICYISPDRPIECK